MNKEKINHFKNMLLKEKINTQKTLKSMNENEPNSSMQNYFSELSVYDNHPADIGTEMFEMEMNMCLKNSEDVYIRKIDDVLDRMENGNYGICELCGKEISEERLEILPISKLCINCEKKEEIPLDEINKTRPIEEQVLANPFGRTFLDKNENYNGFDGEDALQSVTSFNKTHENHMALDWYDNNMYDGNVSNTIKETEFLEDSFHVVEVDKD
ncbi:TraR/DksA C4-type zinc finger protein [Lutibacter sp. B2]|nr:TraR/DksA C4-type zinc finger protein [Lutibacter sp. B2]